MSHRDSHIVVAAPPPLPVRRQAMASLLLHKVSGSVPRRTTRTPPHRPTLWHLQRPLRRRVEAKVEIVMREKELGERWRRPWGSSRPPRWSSRSNRIPRQELPLRVAEPVRQHEPPQVPSARRSAARHGTTRGGGAQAHIG